MAIVSPRLAPPRGSGLTDLEVQEASPSCFLPLWRPMCLLWALFLLFLPPGAACLPVFDDQVRSVESSRGLFCLSIAFAVVFLCLLLFPSIYSISCPGNG